MAKDKALERFLTEWAKSEEVQDKLRVALDKELTKALKVWSKNGTLAPSKQQMLKLMSKTKFKKALSDLKRKARP